MSESGMTEHRLKPHVRRVSIAVVLVIIALVVWFYPCTPERAIRLYLLKECHPIAAFTIRVASVDPSESNGYWLYKTISDPPPTLHVTCNPMRYWEIKRTFYGYDAEWSIGPIGPSGVLTLPMFQGNGVGKGD